MSFFRQERVIKVLVVSPNLDDEMSGASGTILRLMAEGYGVYWLNVVAILNEKWFCKGMIVKRRKQLEELFLSFFRSVSFKYANNGIGKSGFW